MKLFVQKNKYIYIYECLSTESPSCLVRIYFDTSDSLAHIWVCNVSRLIVHSTIRLLILSSYLVRCSCKLVFRVKLAVGFREASRATATSQMARFVWGKRSGENGGANAESDRWGGRLFCEGWRVGCGVNSWIVYYVLVLIDSWTSLELSNYLYNHPHAVWHETVELGSSCGKEELNTWQPLEVEVIPDTQVLYDSPATKTHLILNA